MRLPAIVLVTLITPGLALACPGKTASADEDVHQAVEKGQSHTSLDAAACAKKAALVGGSCSYSTGMMASRVLEQGKNFTYTGTLVPTDEVLPSQVAAPFVAGPQHVRVIANEVVESASDSESRMTWTGKLLEVEGVRYFVVTRYEKAPGQVPSEVKL